MECNNVQQKLHQLQKKWWKNLCLYIQQQCFLEFFVIYFNNGNAVPMRSSSFLTLGTGFPSFTLEMTLALRESTKPGKWG